MKKLSVVFAACALLLAGCAHFGRAPNPVRPQVFVVDGRLIVLNAEPLVFSRRGEVVITWHLPWGTNYTFDEKGVEINGRFVRETNVLREGLLQQTFVLDPRQDEIGNCSRSKDGLEFSCVNRNTKPGRYKYTIRVRDGTKPLDPLDPWLVND